jgi:tetratricopeptide (TPR) repeat protein
MKALEKDRSRRYETARDFACDLQRYLADEPVRACPPTAQYRFRKFARRNKMALATVAIVAISLMSGTIISVWQAANARRAEALADSRLKNEAEARQEASAISAILQQMLQSAGPYQAHGGDYSVRQMLDDFSARLGDQLQDQPATRAAIHAIIGQTYLELGAADKAESHLKTALDLRRQTFGAEHELVALSLVDYAWYLRKVGRTADAEKPAREALDIRQKLGNCDPALMVANLHLLQNIAASRHLYDEAEAFAQQALEIARAQPQPLPGESSILRTSADTALLQGDLVKAERLAREALASHQKLKGGDHLASAASWNALGNVLNRQCKFGQAEECYRQSIVIFVKRVGYCPIEVLDSLSTILDAKNDQAALKELHPLAEAEEQKSGPYSWQKAVARGSLRARLGEWDKAEAHFRKTIELAPASDIETCAKAYYFIALLRQRASDHSGYRAAAIAALDRQSAKPSLANFHVVYAGVAAPDSAVDPAQLVKLAENGLSQHGDDPAWLTVYGAALYRARRWQDAQTALAKAIDTYESTSDSCRQLNVHAHALLLQAMVTFQLSRKEEAQQWYKAALTMLESDSLASQSNNGGTSWDCRVIAQLLRQEADQLLMTNSGSANKSTSQAVDSSSDQPPTL